MFASAVSGAASTAATNTAATAAPSTTPRQSTNTGPTMPTLQDSLRSFAGGRTGPPPAPAFNSNRYQSSASGGSSRTHHNNTNNNSSDNDAQQARAESNITKAVQEIRNSYNAPSADTIKCMNSTDLQTLISSMKIGLEELAEINKSCKNFSDKYDGHSENK